MALAVLAITRATEPHLPTLAGTLAPLLSVANSGSFHLRYAGGQVLIEQASFSGVNQTSVQNAVAAAPTRTAALDAKVDIDHWPKPLLAFAELMRVEINRLRTQPSTTFTAYTRAQVLNAIKAEVDNL